MAQYYQVQSIGGDEMKPIYTTADIVLHVSSDDVGVSNPNRAQPIHLDESQQLLLQNDQVVYQTQGTPTQYQPPQAGTHYTILGEDMNQPQAQQVLQQPQQQQQQQQVPPPTQHQQQQVLIHQQQQQPTQQHQVMDIQQHQMQTAYQMTQDPQQHMQAAQEHQMQHVQPPQTQQLYYATDQLVHQQQQKKVYIQQVPQQTMQQQYQPHPQQQTHQQMLHQQQPPPQSPQQQQQHILQSPQHQQVQVQHQVSPSSQQQQQQQAPSQIIYRMQQQPTQLLSNTQLIVQQPSGQQVLIQQQPQQQELLMRQQMPQQRVLYNNQRVMYASQQTAQQQQQQTILQQTSTHPQQQHIHLQTNVMHHNPATTHLVQQARVVPAQHQQQVQQQTPTPPPQQQQMQQNVVYHQIQVPKQNIPQTSTHSQQQTHLQLQQHAQQPQMSNGATIIRATGIARGGKMPRGALIARMPGGAGGIPRAAVFNTSATIAGGGGGQTLRTPRPRCSTSAGNTTGRGRGGRTGRGAASTIAAGRGVQVAAAGSGAMVSANSPQLATLQQAKIVAQGQGGIRQIYRTQLTDGNVHQQVHLVQSQPRMPGVGARFKTPTVGVQQQQSQQSPQQSSPSTGSGSSGGNFDLDLEDSIQAVFVKKDGQKQAPGMAINQNVAPNSSGQIAGTTLTTYFTAKDDEDSRLIKTQNGCMTLAEYKKRNANSQIMQTANSCIKPLQQNPGGVKITLPAAGPTIPVARVAPQKHIVTKEQPGAGATTTTVASSQVANRPSAGSSVYQTSHNNYEIQTQHVLQNRAGQQMAEKDRNSAKMLVILVSGEQRLITFTLPRESCTVQDLLEQVGVPFDDNTTIQCVENPGANIDFVVTVGFSVQESASELISRAEQSLQISRQQESLQQNSAASSTSASGVSTTSSTSANAPSESPAQNTTPAPSAAATATNMSTTAAASLSENAVKEQQSTNAAKQNSSTSSSAEKSAEEPTAQRKLIQGYYAICQSCGFSGYDHSKCERCKRVFHEPPKKVAIKQVSSSSGNTGCYSNSSSSASSESSSSSLSMDKKRHGAEGNLPSSQRSKASAYNPNGPPIRGRGGSQGPRGRGTRSGRRPAEVEPVILTLSSDEEDDESSNKGMSNYGTLTKTANALPLSLMTAYKPLAFESNIPDSDEALIYKDFKREDVTDLSSCIDKLNCSLPCKLIRIGSYRFEPAEPVVITSKGIRIVAPLETNQSETFPLHIHKKEVVKVIGNFSKTSDSMLCFYTLRNCAEYIRNSLKMTDIAKPLDGVAYFTANGPNQMRKIIIQFQMLSEQSKSVIRSIWEFLDEISDSDAQDLLQRAAESEKKLANNKSNSENLSTTTQLQPNEIRQLLIYPPGKGGISINTEDYMCLATDQYLNDIIIDFYLKWVHDHIIPEAEKDRTHIFSTFFYKRLTTLTRHVQQDKDVKQTAAQKRHARVQNWTKNVNLFEKDFVIIPINEQSHWFLAIICFPRLKGPVTFETGVPVELQPIKKTKGKKVSLQIGNTTITPLSKRDSGNVLSDVCGVGDDDSERDEAEGDDSDLASEESDFENSSSNTTTTSQQAIPVLTGASCNNTTQQAIKQPLILIFDSLAGASRSRVVATLRDYLSCEYKIKMPEAPLHTFNKDNMPGHCVKVPQQNNFTDCGLYLLQYVEQFFKDPIRDYRVPIKQLANWFDTLTVTRKREDISSLLQKLMNERNGPNKVILPEIPFPTLNGLLVEPDGFNIEFEEEEMDDDDDEENQTGDVDDLSTDDTSKSKTPIKMPPTPPSTATVPTLPALVPTQARKIVLKRRMQVLGPSASDSSPQTIGNASPCTTGTTPTSAQGQLQRSTNMTKIRKVEP